MTLDELKQEAAVKANEIEIQWERMNDPKTAKDFENALEVGTGVGDGVGVFVGVAVGVDVGEIVGVGEGPGVADCVGVGKGGYEVIGGK